VRTYSLIERKLLGALRQARACGWAYVSHQELFDKVLGADNVTTGHALETLIAEGLVARVDDHLFRFALVRDVPDGRLRPSALASR
jgi:hypothetical protein